MLRLALFLNIEQKWASCSYKIVLIKKVYFSYNYEDLAIIWLEAWSVLKNCWRQMGMY